jgi:zinc/manganese transport system permease protein
MFASYMTNSWIVAGIVALVSGVVGFFVVLRGSSFAAHALPLGTFPGAAAASLLGLRPIVGLVAFAALGVLGISQLGRRHERHEVATALCLVTLLGAGDLFLSLSRHYAQGVFSYLFGEILGVGADQIAPVAAISLIAVVLVAVLFRPLLLASLSPDLAEARGIPARRMELCFLAILALTTAMALPVVGALLVFSLMVGPASAARAMTDRPLRALALSAGLALALVWGSIALSFTTDWPIGFFVGVLSAVCYGVGRLWQARPVRRGLAF